MFFLCDLKQIFYIFLPLWDGWMDGETWYFVVLSFFHIVDLGYTIEEFCDVATAMLKLIFKSENIPCIIFHSTP